MPKEFYLRKLKLTYQSISDTLIKNYKEFMHVLSILKT